MNGVTTDEILAAIRDLRTPVERPAGAFTVEEAAAATGLGHTATQNRVRKLLRAGRLELVSFQIVTMHGKTTTTTGYRIKAKAKAGR